MCLAAECVFVCVFVCVFSNWMYARSGECHCSSEWITLNWWCVCVFSAVEHVHVCLVAECIFVSGTLRTGTSSCARAVRYHTNAIVVSDFTIATRKWAKLHQHGVRQSVALKDILLLPCRREACWGLYAFTTRGLTAGVSRESFQALTDFTQLYR